MSAHAAKAAEVSPERIVLDGIEVNEELGFRIHPFAEAFPMMEGAEFDELVEDIRKNGLREPAEYILHKGEKVIVDGRNRLKACIAANVEPVTSKCFAKPGDDHLLSYIWSKNVHRRQLTASQRSMIAAEHQAFIDAITKTSARRRKATQGRPKKGAKRTQRKVAPSKKTAAVVAKSAEVSTRTMEHAMAVKKSGDVKLISEVKAGTKSVSAAAKELQTKKAPTKTTKPAAAKKAAPAKKAPSKKAVREVRIEGGQTTVTRTNYAVGGGVLVTSQGITVVLASFVEFVMKCRKEFKSNFTPELSTHAEQLEKELRSLLQQTQP